MVGVVCTLLLLFIGGGGANILTGRAPQTTEHIGYYDNFTSILVQDRRIEKCWLGCRVRTNAFDVMQYRVRC